jgi:hypothetical protein
MLVDLTSENQTKLINDDCKRVAVKQSPHYSVMQHIRLISQRLDALEAARLTNGGDHG